jgi:hypothetical protein
MSSRSFSPAKPQHHSAHQGPESRLARGGGQPAARKDVRRRLVPLPAVVSRRDAPLIPPGLRLEMIRDAAYFRAAARGFAPGKEIEDWLAAEQDVEELILRRYGH